MTSAPDQAATWRRIDEICTPFSTGLATWLKAWCGEAPQVELVEAGPRFAEFRLQPHVLLPELSAIFAGLQRSAPDPGHVVFVIDSIEDRGLDAVELPVVLGQWLEVSRLERLALSGHVSRTVVAGRLRHEHLGLSFTIDAGSPTGGRAASAQRLSMLAEVGAVPAVLFVTAVQARILRALPWSRLTKVLRHLAALGCRPGLIASQASASGAQLAAEFEVLRGLFNVSPDLRLIVRSPTELVDAGATEQFLRAAAEAGAEADASVLPGRPFDPQLLARWGSYLPAGAYRPQPFDLRTPAGRWADDSVIEIVRVPLGSLDLRELWRTVRLPDQARLARLLDYYRIESYMRRIADVGLAQRYHEFRVYNWGAEDPSPRTLLIDGGSLDDMADAAHLAREWREMADQHGHIRWHADAATFFDAARKEAASRSTSHVIDVLREQESEHEYLIEVADAPLRADVASFVAGMAPALGQTLELGAGYGRLAAELAPRSTRYVCVDLQASMMEPLRGIPNASGAVADFHALPFAGGSFETVVANNVLEHSYDPIAAFAEIGRVMAPEATLHALIPLDGLNPDYRLPAHLWKADLHAIRNAVEAAGLAVEATDVLSLYALAIPASFPSCEGLVCALRARRAG